MLLQCGVNWHIELDAAIATSCAPTKSLRLAHVDGNASRPEYHDGDLSLLCLIRKEIRENSFWKGSQIRGNSLCNQTHQR